MALPRGPMPLGEYDMVAKLGAGSFAQVFRAVHRTKGTVRAVKAIQLERLSPKLLKGLEAEITILREVRHPNIIELVDVRRSTRWVYLILEFAAGGDLSDVLATRPDGRMPEFEARMLFRQLAAGLQTLWSRRLIHRDIKPQNILLSAPWPAAGTLRPDGTVIDPDGGPPTPLPTTLVKLGDFGFARHLAVADMAETLCGSPLYMAPELLRFQRYDARCDLWSAGAVLFQMLAGRPAFRGANPMELLRAIDTAPVAGAPPFPRGVEPSAAALSLIDGLLQRDPDRRITIHALGGDCGCC
ncbi:hypothetical protein FNF27_04475 [Cafeteria roenbergensis]|uniref:Protein kinase domain-containing protein n=1 Tax=Cafeteria roenbergensis TaxID=33653 RepID=A0A5A8D5M1_CAFRO|nr:hypothetical protein FNF28_05326 [Cafeteria roenbergensis]KAA0174089.1 hypothetical protein FNF27_04475 [Cafeteria roenbergensis]